MILQKCRRSVGRGLAHGPRRLKGASGPTKAESKIEMPWIKDRNALGDANEALARQPTAKRQIGREKHAGTVARCRRARVLGCAKRRGCRCGLCPIRSAWRRLPRPDDDAPRFYRARRSEPPRNQLWNRCETGGAQKLSGRGRWASGLRNAERCGAAWLASSATRSRLNLSLAAFPSVCSARSFILRPPFQLENVRKRGRFAAVQHSLTHSAAPLHRNPGRPEAVTPEALIQKVGEELKKNGTRDKLRRLSRSYTADACN